jgi:hypothetical protein
MQNRHVTKVRSACKYVSTIDAIMNIDKINIVTIDIEGVSPMSKNTNKAISKNLLR